jgi:hypothetical protein
MTNINSAFDRSNFIDPLQKSNEYPDFGDFTKGTKQFMFRPYTETHKKVKRKVEFKKVKCDFCKKDTVNKTNFCDDCTNILSKLREAKKVSNLKQKKASN